LPELPHLVREPTGDPEGALVLLHGRGVDETDLFPLLDQLDPDRRLFGLTPGAPLTGISPGGRHWYVIERVGHPDERTFVASLRATTEFIDDTLRTRGIDWERTVIGGFSQGTAVSYAIALGEGRPRPAGILALSGFLPSVSGWPMDIGAGRGLPVYIAHGSLDPMIPAEFGRSSAEALEEAGLDVTFRESPIPHTIDPELLPEMRQWVASVIAGNRAPEHAD
jgi:phospholipase/carboxylesterase